MADSLLARLCTICHEAKPKYKCPRCFARTCSLHCYQNHEVEKNCDGFRNVTASGSKAATPAFVDQGTNSFRAIEQSKRQFEDNMVSAPPAGVADSLLTSLCTICHEAKPKYKCPRCLSRTCSVSCVQKHKLWKNCNGIRDATAYVPKVATPSVVDHDYNFLSAIERSRRQFRHILVNKGLVTQGELPLTVQQVEWKWRGDKKRRVLVTRTLKPRSAGEKRLQARLREFKIKLTRAPLGMSYRRRDSVKALENKPGLEWPVEWTLVTAAHGQQDIRKQGSRSVVWSTAWDNIPVGLLFLECHRCEAFAWIGPAPTTWEQQNFAALPSCALQDPSTTVWPLPQTASSQNLTTGAWMTENPAGGSRVQFKRPLEWLKKRVTFYLSERPVATSSLANVLPLDPAQTLREALSGTLVMENPRVCVLWGCMPLPAGLAVQGQPRENGWKRRLATGNAGGGPDRLAKRRKVSELEEGEIPIGADTSSEDEAKAAASEGDELDDTSSAGDVVDEMSSSGSENDLDANSDTASDTDML